MTLNSHARAISASTRGLGAGIHVFFYSKIKDVDGWA